jgi:hypothetical protein
MWSHDFMLEITESDKVCRNLILLADSELKYWEFIEGFNAVITEYSINEDNTNN